MLCGALMMFQLKTTCPCLSQDPQRDLKLLTLTSVCIVLFCSKMMHFIVEINACRLRKKIIFHAFIVASCCLGVGVFFLLPGRCSGCIDSIDGMILDYNNFRDRVIGLLVDLKSASTKAECCKIAKQLDSYSDLQYQTGKKISFCQGDDDVMRRYRTSLYPQHKQGWALLRKKCCVPFAQYLPMPKKSR